MWEPPFENLGSTSLEWQLGIAEGRKPLMSSGAGKSSRAAPCSAGWESQELPGCLVGGLGEQALRDTSGISWARDGGKEGQEWPPLALLGSRTHHCFLWLKSTAPHQNQEKGVEQRGRE